MKRILPVILGNILVFGLLAWVIPAFETGSAPSAASATWTRPLEPVIMPGSQVPLFNSVDNRQIFAYKFSGGSWVQIPFQIDEINIDGDYTPEDGLLDANDELVFMAVDGGEKAATNEWIDDADSQSYVRYEVGLTNPLNTEEEGWIYIYRSSTLLPAAGDYVNWDPITQQIQTETYVLGISTTGFFGVDIIELNGSEVDALDRSKFRVDLTCWYFIPLELNEESLPEIPDITPDIDGPVRVGGGDATAGIWSYKSLYQIRTTLNIDSIQPPDICAVMDIDWVRVSFDWLNPTLSGMAPAKYYDANIPAGVNIDGTPDSVPTSPVNNWTQISGAQGSMVQVIDVSLGGGTVSNYYKDNSAVDNNDTGDKQSFGDSGYRVDNPSGQLSFTLQDYILGAGQPNVGSLYASYKDNPIQVAANDQTYDCKPYGVDFSYPAPVNAGAQTTFTSSVSAGQLPYSFDWLFGDYGSTPSGNPVNHVFEISGTFPVTMTASNTCGAADPVIHDVNVLAADYFIYLPLTLRSAP